jgi:hypothetical protein
VFHIAETRAAYEFFRSVRADASSRGEHSPAGSSEVGSGPEIIYPVHGARLDYRDFTGKPAIEFLRSLSGRYGRVWVVLMNNGAASNPDATTVTLTRILGDSFAEQRVEFPQVEVRLYSRAAPRRKKQ